MTLAVAPISILARGARQRGAIARIVPPQPLGAVSFLIIFPMMFAGLSRNPAAPYYRLGIDFVSMVGAAVLAALVRHRCLRARHLLAADLRLTHGAGDRLHVLVRRFLVGAVLGITSAYFGGRVDNWIQRFMDILLAFPIIVLALIVVAALGPGAGGLASMSI